MRTALLLVLLVALSACAPTVVTLATLAASGISYVATGKSVTDHAITLVAQRDCALHRVVRGESPCQGQVFVEDETLAAADAETDIQLASAAGPSLAIGPSSAIVTAGLQRDGLAQEDAPLVLHHGGPQLLATIGVFASRAVHLEGFPPTTELYALLQDDGSLEVYLHDPTKPHDGANIQLIITIVDYANDPEAFAGVRINGDFRRIAAHIV